MSSHWPREGMKRLQIDISRSDYELLQHHAEQREGPARERTVSAVVRDLVQDLKPPQRTDVDRLWRRTYQLLDAAQRQIQKVAASLDSASGDLAADYFAAFYTPLNAPAQLADRWLRACMEALIEVNETFLEEARAANMVDPVSTDRETDDEDLPVN